jgi:hypothetical protein
MTQALVPLPLNVLGPSHSPETVTRALTLVEEHGGVYRGYKALAAEFEARGIRGPAYSTIWKWVSEREEVISRIDTHEKRKMSAISGEVAVDAAERMLEALPNLSDSQIPVAYGIAMQKRTEWENAGSKVPAVAVQFNLVTREKS